MNELDQTIRKMMLSYPLIFPTRAAVLQQLFCCNGNGLEWEGGRLTGRGAMSADFDEEKAKSEFFSDIDKRQRDLKDIVGDEDYRATRDATQRIDRARRQFQLDNLDDLVISTDGEGFSDGHALLRGYYKPGWCGMNIPDDAENSFRDGAIEALSEALVKMRGAGLDGHPVVQEIESEYQRLTPQFSNEQLAELLGQPLKPRDPIEVSRFDTQAVKGCFEMTVDDFLAIERAESKLLFEDNMSLFEQLEGRSRAGIPGIDGVHSVEYNGHFGAAIHLTIDAEHNLPSTHAAICKMIRAHVSESHRRLAEAKLKEEQDAEDCT
tara:strand:+ start:51 stop:1016 length:966 start_codon:yes stop_codon:yes gene_type:complete